MFELWWLVISCWGAGSRRTPGVRTFASLLLTAIPRAMAADNQTTFLVWHPMKTGGTTLCSMLIRQQSLLVEGHAPSEDLIKEHLTGLNWNCKLTNDDVLALYNLTGVMYSEVSLPSEGHIPELLAASGRRFFFLEPSWYLRHTFHEWTLPPFLSPSSPAWDTYTHVFLIRDPLQRAWSAVHFFNMPGVCNCSGGGTEFLQRLAAGTLPKQGSSNECDKARAIANGALTNFYVRHLTGTPDAVSLARQRLEAMHVIDISNEDVNCTRAQISQVFGIEEQGLEIPQKRIGSHGLLPEEGPVASFLKLRLAGDLQLYEWFKEAHRAECASLQQ